MTNRPDRNRLRGGALRGGALAAALVAAMALPATARADVPDVVWEALLERAIVVEKADGSVVEGKLIGVRSAAIVVMKDDGEPVSVDRAAVKAVRGQVPVTPAPAPAPIVVVPPATGPRPAVDAPPPPTPPPPPPRFDFPGYAGFMLRPAACLLGSSQFGATPTCAGLVPTFGPEVGYRFGGGRSVSA